MFLSSIAHCSCPLKHKTAPPTHRTLLPILLPASLFLMLFPPQLTLSAIYNTANILTALLHYSQPLPATATLAADILFALSLLASGIWLCLAATTAIDGNTALAIHFAKHSRYQYYSSPDHAKIANINSAIEIVGIALTFLAAYVFLLAFPFSPCLYRTMHT